MALSKRLREFADSLAPTDEVIHRARQATRKVQDALHQMSGLSVDRVVPLGSYAKKTSLGHDMDVDLHVFLNNEMPPFPSAISKIEATLRRLDPNVRVGSHAIKLKVDGIVVDVLPTANMVDKYISKSGSASENQIAYVLYHLKHEAGSHVNKKHDFSTSLSESAVEFEKRHSAFSHAMSRLAKFWASKMGSSHEPHGKSSIMEYLGARAAELEEKERNQDMLKAFRRFLNMVKKPQSIFVYWDYFYSRADIPAQMMAQRPLLLDPSNPYDNFFQGVSHAYYNELSSFAGDTLAQLDAAERNGTIPHMFRYSGITHKVLWPKFL